MHISVAITVHVFLCLFITNLHATTPAVFSEALIGSNENIYTDPAAQEENEEEVEQKEHGNEKEEEVGEWDEVSSQVSSASSEDYIVILPDCFDTSRPLGDSMYSSAMSQPAAPSTNEAAAPQIHSSAEGEIEETTTAPALQNSLNKMLCTSQILDTPSLIPEMVPASIALSPPPSLRTHRYKREHSIFIVLDHNAISNIFVICLNLLMILL